MLKNQDLKEGCFDYELRSQGDIKTLMSKLLDYETVSMGEHEDDIARIEMYRNLKMCVEEVVLNVFKHGYRGAAPLTDSRVRVQMERCTERIQVDISDNATPFDPLTQRTPVPISEVALGVDLIIKLVDGISYKRTEKGNKLSFYMRLK